MRLGSGQRFPARQYTCILRSSSPDKGSLDPAGLAELGDATAASTISFLSRVDSALSRADLQAYATPYQRNIS
jgi:hypothetical protein